MERAQVGLSLIKQLASCNKNSREKSVRILLKSWLPTQTEILDEDMKKLWKGLFYCVWHADKLAAQADLIDRLSSALFALHLPLSVDYLSVFLLTMRREWSGIDGLRLDKFYLLIRRFLHCFFVLLKKNSWDLELSCRLMGVLGEGTFYANDKFQGNGVNYHVASVFVEELKPFLPLRKEVLEVLFKSFVSVMGRVFDKVLLGKIKSNVFDVLLNMGRELLEVKKSGVDDVDSGDDVAVLGPIGLAMGFSSKFYELGSSAECCQGNRKVLFGLHEEFLKLEKDLAASGIEILIPEVNVDDEEEVPNLIPVGNGMEVDGGPGDVDVDVANGSSGKILRKCKKAKKSSAKKKQKKKDMVSDLNTKDSPLNKENSENVVTENGENTSVEQITDDNLLMFNEPLMSNLQMQFERVAADVGLDNHVASACDMPKTIGNGTVSKKRKRAKSMDGKKTQNAELTGQADAEGGMTAKSGEKSAKKVRFSMKNNVVWKPQSPLPPQSLRLPPSVTPRGSALKKGVPAGPIREMLPATKKVKRAKAVNKGRKVIKSPAIKRLKKLKSLTT